ncbi:hypothetical protein JCM12856_07720 [Spirochaeta dissipatitropha]
MFGAGNYALNVSYIVHQYCCLDVLSACREIGPDPISQLFGFPYIENTVVSTAHNIDARFQRETGNRFSQFSVNKAL